MVALGLNGFAFRLLRGLIICLTFGHNLSVHFIVLHLGGDHAQRSRHCYEHGRVAKPCHDVP